MNFYIWAALATISSCLVVYFWVGRFAELQTWRWYRLAIVTLPLSAIVNLAIKKPLGHALGSLAGVGDSPASWPIRYVAIALALAPLTEETIKLVPIGIRRLRRALLGDVLSANGAGTFLGLGFGIGEAWYLAWSFTVSRPEMATGSFLPLFGFFGERTAAALAHVCFTSILCIGISRKAPVRAFLTAAGLHYLLNIGAGLHRAGYVSSEVATVVISVSFLAVLRIAIRTQETLLPADRSLRRDEVLLRKDD